MSAFLEFLNEMFGPSSGAESNDIKEFFHVELGVKVDILDDLYLFKYDMLSVKWNDVTYECRGTVAHRSAEGVWSYVSRPPEKFFNLQESRCKYNTWEGIVKDIDSIDLVQKADGTAIQMYYWGNQWRVSTLGKIEPSEVQGYPFTYHELFIKLFNEDGFAKADPKYCYFFELCTSCNTIVTQYPKDSVFLLLARNVETGEYVSQQDLDNIAEYDFKVTRPIRIKLNTLNLKSMDELLEYVETESKNPVYGFNSEGFVLCNPAPIGKAKNRKYLILHKNIGGGDSASSINNIIELFFEGMIDDFYGDLQPIQRTGIDSLKNHMIKLSRDSEMFLTSIDFNNISRKEYALRVNSLDDLRQYSSYLFNRFDPEYQESFTEWISKSGYWKKQTSVWKTFFKV